MLCSLLIFWAIIFISAFLWFSYIYSFTASHLAMPTLCSYTIILLAAAICRRIMKDFFISFTYRGRDFTKNFPAESDWQSGWVRALLRPVSSFPAQRSTINEWWFHADISFIILYYFRIENGHYTEYVSWLRYSQLLLRMASGRYHCTQAHGLYYIISLYLYFPSYAWDSFTIFCYIHMHNMQVSLRSCPCNIVSESQ